MGCSAMIRGFPGISVNAELNSLLRNIIHNELTARRIALGTDWSRYFDGLAEKLSLADDRLLWAAFRAVA